MDVEIGEGEGEEEEELADDLEIEPERVLAAPSLGDGCLSSAPAPKRRNAMKRRENKDDDKDDIYQTEVASETPPWFAKDTRLQKVANKVGKFYKCFLGLNPLENITKKNPVGRQLDGVGPEEN